VNILHGHSSKVGVNARPLITRERLVAHGTSNRSLRILTSVEMCLDASLVEAMCAAEDDRITCEWLAVNVTDSAEQSFSHVSPAKWFL
jgi:hypothetical protein